MDKGAIKMSVNIQEAIAKATANQPKRQRQIFNDVEYDCLICPTCDTVLSYIGRLRGGWNYCANCGQKLKV